MNKEKYDLLAYCPEKKGWVAKHLPYLSHSECADLVAAYIYKDRDKFDSVVEDNLHKGKYVGSKTFSYKEIEVMLQNYRANYDMLMLKFPDDHFRSDVERILSAIFEHTKLGNVSETIRMESLHLFILLHLNEGLKIATPENFFLAKHHCDLTYTKYSDGKWKIYGATTDNYGLPMVYNLFLSYSPVASSEILWSNFTIKKIIRNVLIAIVVVAITIPIGLFFANLGFFIFVIIWLVLGTFKELTGRKGF